MVKELAENAVDAGARTIIIEVFKGGLERITVSDDGHGMEPQDLALAVDRHATSKISSSADLFDINTLGFRGEALASIGAVAELTVVSRTRDRWEGSRIVVRGGEKGAVEPVASPGGTKVTVANLFYNTPARMKFLRSAAAEFAAITQTVSQLILACPHIAFKLSHNGKSVLNAPGTGDQDAVACLVRYCRHCWNATCPGADIRCTGISPTLNFTGATGPCSFSQSTDVRSTFPIASAVKSPSHPASCPPFSAGFSQHQGAQRPGGCKCPSCQAGSEIYRRQCSFSPGVQRLPAGSAGHDPMDFFRSRG